MTLPGLPPAQRRELPTPPGGAAAARRAGRRRQGAVATTAVAVSLVAAATSMLLSGSTPSDVLQAARGGDSSPAAPSVQLGRVVDAAGQPLPDIAVLRADLTAVLTRSRADGTWSAPCGTELVFAAYAPTTRGGPVRERSPGAGNVAWRRLREHCGQSATVVLPVGGVLLGRGTPGADVRVQRVRGSSREVPELGPVFVTRVRPDGTWRVEGLDTGRYLLPGGRTVDVREGGTFS